MAYPGRDGGAAVNHRVTRFRAAVDLLRQRELNTRPRCQVMGRHCNRGDRRQGGTPSRLHMNPLQRKCTGVESGQTHTVSTYAAARNASPHRSGRPQDSHASTSPPMCAQPRPHAHLRLDARLTRTGWHTPPRHPLGTAWRSGAPNRHRPAPVHWPAPKRLQHQDGRQP
jgi:hypothetical protein